MTYSVPYSFVPGTKAKADEVNANFIDLLNKIEETNGRIDQANESLSNSNQEIAEKIEEINASKVDLSLSNIDSTAKALFNNKANAADIDGAWTYKLATVLDGTQGASSTKKVSLSSYLPNDGKRYEVLMSLTCQTTNYCYMSMNSDIITATNIPCLRCKGNPQYDSGFAIIPVGKGRYVNFITNSTCAGTNTFWNQALGYRKVR